MSTETQWRSVASDDGDGRRRGADRRSDERRRSARGLFELRARRAGVAEDRRRRERRDGPPQRRWYTFWRRDKD